MGYGKRNKTFVYLLNFHFFLSPNLSEQSSQNNKLMGNICKIQNVFLFITYCTTISAQRELLRRQIEDPTVFNQYLQNGHRCEKYDHLGFAWYGDFFQSEAYAELLKTIPEELNDLPPLCLAIYRLVIKIFS